MAGNVSIASCSGSIGSYAVGNECVAATKADYNKPKTYHIDIGGHQLKITNYSNTYIAVDALSFVYDVTETGVKLHVQGNYCNIAVKSIQELKDYISRVRQSYLKAKEFEKQLNLAGDFA